MVARRGGAGKKDRGAAPDAAAIGELIARLRAERGLSQAALARLSGVKQRTIGYIEQGGDCLLGTARRLAGALGVTVGDLDRRLPAPDLPAPS